MWTVGSYFFYYQYVEWGRSLGSSVSLHNFTETPSPHLGLIGVNDGGLIANTNNTDNGGRDDAALQQVRLISYSIEIK